MTNFLISAARKSSGKTSLSIGLAALLRSRGRRVQTFKKGPDYIDPMWLSAASGRACINLDFYTMPHDEIKQVYGRYSKDTDVVLVEGNKGLYDGMAVDGSDSNAGLAKLLHLPVILLLDASGITRGIAPLLHGYQTFDRDIHIAGVVLNKVAGDRHERKLCNAIARYSDIPVLGSIHRTPDMQIEERHIGLLPSNEDRRARSTIEGMARIVSSSVDVDKILALAEQDEGDSQLSLAALPLPTTNNIRIGIAQDEAFAFYYPDDVEKMSVLGAELVSFDTLRDTALPDVDALFIGGGFPECYLDALHGNDRLRAEIKQFIEAGFPVYAECGGLMYLCKDITYEGVTRAMVGALTASAVMKPRPVGRGYVQLVETAKHPWPRVVDGPDQNLRAHEFHYSQLENLGGGVEFAYRVERGVGIKDSCDGLIYKNTLATYTHHRNVGLNHWVERFVAHIKQGKYRSHAGSCAPGEHVRPGS